ncbi:MAG: hypothetical protein OQK04_16395 [Kangiellaceae bacterium]|nr:hypothetical protein [Kangiellaceae bacterium]MCW9000290.1 hypothetical protein [Kangiellaceae bacterium]
MHPIKHILITMNQSIEEEVNLDGEFLGVSSLAIYSAPWYLQLILLLLVATLFTTKIIRKSKSIQVLVQQAATNDVELMLRQVNRAFFGISVPAKNLTAYWIGFLIYLITLGYAVYNTYANLALNS